MGEDESLQKEIIALLNKMDKQPFFGDSLKRKLLFLNEENCIEIQSVDFKCSEDSFLLSLMVNGLFTVTDSSYSKVADELSNLMETFIDG